MHSVVVGTAGHIDHGKSALVRALTGTDPDRLKEERERGITIDLGFAHLLLGDLMLAFVDVPGHERFVKNMLAGAGGIDVVLLVVDATEGVMPQTREHFDICRLLQVRGGLVALTKIDRADPTRAASARAEVRTLVSGSFLEGAPIVPVSAHTGEGLDALRAALSAAAAGASGGRGADGPIRLPIDRAFSVKGFGTVVTGTLAAGTIAVGARLAILPDGPGVSVRGLQVHGGGRQTARAGERVAVNLSGVNAADVARGQSLVAPDRFVTTRTADARVQALGGARPLRHNARIRFHQGTAEVIGRVAIAGAPSGDGPAEIPAGGDGYIRLRLERPVVLARGDRYILRSYSPAETIAGGAVLDPAPRHGTRGTSARERLQHLDGCDRSALGAMILDAPCGSPVTRLAARFGANPAVLETHIQQLADAGRIVRHDDTVVDAAAYERLKRGLVDRLVRYHAAEPFGEGLPREEARVSAFGRCNPAVFDGAVRELAAAGVITGHGRLRLAAHTKPVDSEEERARARITDSLKRAALMPPDIAALARDAGVTADVAERIVRGLQREQRAVRIGTLWFDAEALGLLKATVARLKAESGSGARLDVGTFKARFGVTRKFAIPLLEYLDRERITRRVGDARVIL